jgi:outer membrane protein, heavy metal efflux system
MKKAAHVLMSAALALSGCAGHRTEGRSGPCLPGADLSRSGPPRNEASRGAATFVEPAGGIQLRAVLAAALLGNPELKAYSWEARAAEARVLQAGLLPNPELEVETEEFGGEGELRGFDGATTGLRISQLIELGGKRRKRQEVASLERRLAGWDYEAKRLDVLTQTAKSFLAVLEAQQRLKLVKQTTALAQEVSTTVEARVSAGKVSPLEKLKASVALASSRIELDRARRELEVRRRRLAAHWGSTTPKFEAVQHIFGAVTELPELPKVLKLAEQNPDMARWTTEIMVRQAALKLEKAQRVPDVALTGGVSRSEETEDHAFAVGISIPLPLFDRNQGGIREARMNLQKVLEERRAAQVLVITEIIATYHELAASAAELKVLDGSLLPAARKAFAAAREGYAQGKFNYLEVLDAQRTLVEARSQRLRVLAAYHTAVVDMERFIGRSLAAVETRVPKESVQDSQDSVLAEEGE